MAGRSRVASPRLIVTVEVKTGRPTPRADVGLPRQLGNRLGKVDPVGATLEKGVGLDRSVDRLGEIGTRDVKLPGPTRRFEEERGPADLAERSRSRRLRSVASQLVGTLDDFDPVPLESCPCDESCSMSASAVSTMTVRTELRGQAGDEFHPAAVARPCRRGLRLSRSRHHASIRPGRIPFITTRPGRNQRPAVAPRCPAVLDRCG